MYDLIAYLAQPFTLLCLLALLAAANLWRKRVETRRRLLLATCPLLILLAACTPAVAYLALGSLEWRYPPRPGRPVDTQAIVVLASGMRLPDQVRLHAELTESSLCRCILAARLYRDGGPCPVIVSGGRVDPREPGPTLAEVMHDFLTQHGVAESDILMERRSRTTHENAVLTAEKLRQRGIGRITLVTSATHLLRSELCFQAQRLEVTCRGCQYRATEFDWRLTDFLPDPGAAEDVHSAAHEWLGVFWYWLHGRI